jgi:hypothetical protein
MGNTKRTAIFRNATLICVLSVLVLCSGCIRQHDYPDWFVGSWKSEFDGIGIEETWQKSGGKLVGKTVWHTPWDNNNRTEILTLYYQDDSLIYRLKTEHKKTLEFVCQDPSNDTLVFVNNKNDFPKRLVYVKPTGTRMSVWIDNEPGDPNQIQFPFKKD